MNLNFKKNNLLIIMLLIFVILSCIIFVNMSNVKESFTNYNSINRNFFVNFDRDTSYNYYKLNTDLAKYRLSTYPALPTNLILENSNNLTSTDIRLRTRNLEHFKQKNIMLLYYNSESVSDISLLNIRNNLPVSLDISTIAVRDTSNIGTMNMIFMENSGNFYDLSNIKLSNFTLQINREVIIKDGSIVQPPPPTPETSGNTLFTNNPSFYNDFNLYLLRQGAFGSNYIPPIYNNFETAMNLPSNPIVNPINTMNPLDYANTLFGPNISPTMISNMCLNQNVARVTDSTTILRESSNNLVSTLGNNRTNNSNHTNNSNSYNRNQNYMRESYPPYQPPLIFSEPIQENTSSESIPRPVLTDFSSFGM